MLSHKIGIAEHIFHCMLYVWKIDGTLGSEASLEYTKTLK